MEGLFLIFIFSDKTTIEKECVKQKTEMEKRNALMSYNLVKHHAIKEKINFAYIQILINDLRNSRSYQVSEVINGIIFLFTSYFESYV